MLLSLSTGSETSGEASSILSTAASFLLAFLGFGAAFDFAGAFVAGAFYISRIIRMSLLLLWKRSGLCRSPLLSVQRQLS